MPDEIGAELVGVFELVPDQQWQVIKDDETFWLEHHRVPETERSEQTNMRTL